MGGPLPGKFTSVRGIPLGLEALVTMGSDVVAALTDDWYESFNELRYGLSHIREAPGFVDTIPSLTNAVCVLGFTFVISVFPSKNACLISSSLLGLNCTRLPNSSVPSRDTVAGRLVVLKSDVDV